MAVPPPTDDAGANDIGAAKQACRARARSLRLIADQKFGPDAAMRIKEHGLAAPDDLGVAAGSVVAGYWPIDTEADVRPLLARLHERGVVCALPRVVEPRAPLRFHRWAPSDDLEDGRFGTRQPLATRETVTPSVVLAPLLAFDAAGHRLGYGAGYYDRTLAALRRARPVTAIGVAYALQRLDMVPHEPHDQPLDWIVTEDGLQRFPL